MIIFSFEIASAPFFHNKLRVTFLRLGIYGAQRIGSALPFRQHGLPEHPMLCNKSKHLAVEMKNKRPLRSSQKCQCSRWDLF